MPDGRRPDLPTVLGHRPAGRLAAQSSGAATTVTDSAPAARTSSSRRSRSSGWARSQSMSSRHIVRGSRSEVVTFTGDADAAISA